MVTTTTPTTTTAATTTATTVTTVESTTEVNTAVPFVPSGYSLLQDELEDIGIPATGDVKLLVFVIDFPDAPLSTSGVGLADIETAFNGATEDTAFESLSSFYLKSSFGKLDLDADLYTYHAPNSTSYYANDYERYYTDSDLIYDMLCYYDATIDYSDYDANGDGNIDGIYVVYTAPVSYSYGSDLWWAYQDYYVYYQEDWFDGVTPDYFCWSGTDFLLEAGDAGVDAHTLIHETGHMLGLDDYYDYDDSDYYNSGGLGGADMMDYAVGDHGPISKILLGWITPLVVTESMTVDLSAYADSGETILVIDAWRGTIFDEYLLLTFYTPTGLYAYDQDYYFSIPGIIIYHVDARIGQGYDETSSYYTIFNYNNTDTAHKFAKIIEADGNGYIDTYQWTQDGDLFITGDVFRGTIAVGYDWYQTIRPMEFTITVVSLDGSSAVLVFDFN
jgi:M6 family metalloprotease-like protein